MIAPRPCEAPEPPAFCCGRPRMLCATERLIWLARQLSSDPLRLLQVAAGRLALRTSRPVSILTNGASRALASARQLELEP